MDYFGVNFWVILIVQGFIFGFASSYLAGQKNKDKGTWFMIGFFLGFIGLITIAASKSEGETGTNVSGVGSTGYIKSSKSIGTPIKFVDLEAPIEITNNKVLLEESTNRPYLTVNLRNLSSKTVTAAKLTVHCYDSFGDPVNGEEENSLNLVMQDLNAKSKELFGNETKYSLNDYSSTRNIDIIIEQVSFEDGSIWKKGNNELKDIAGAVNDGDEDLQEVAGKDAITYPSEDTDTWRCVCGRFNKKANTTCIRCERHKSNVFENYNRDSIIKRIELNREESRKIKEKEKEKKIERNRKNKRKIAIGLTTFVLVLVVFITYSMIEERKNELQLEFMRSFSQKVVVLEKINDLIDKGIDLDAKTNTDYNALHLATRYKNDAEIVKLLIDEGIDLDAKTNTGNSALHLATKYNSNAEIVKLLMLRILK